MRLLQLLIATTVCLSSCSTKVMKEEIRMVELQNPIIPGYFADPSLVQYNGKFYMYVTADPWGTGFLSCWVSDDFQMDISYFKLADKSCMYYFSFGS